MARLSILLFSVGFLLIIGTTLSIVGFYLKLAFILIGSILVLISFLLIKMSIQNDLNNINNVSARGTLGLKNKGLKVKVDFNKCEIITSNHILSKVESRSSLLYFYDSLFFSNDKRPKEILLVRLKFIVKISNKDVSFISEPFRMDVKNFEIYLFNYKKTFIYVNKNNYNDFFFDLDFLKKYAYYEKSLMS
jgi:hypothetical protein